LDVAALTLCTPLQSTIPTLVQARDEATALDERAAELSAQYAAARMRLEASEQACGELREQLVEASEALRCGDRRARDLSNDLEATLSRLDAATAELSALRNAKACEAQVELQHESTQAHAHAHAVALEAALAESQARVRECEALLQAQAEQVRKGWVVLPPRSAPGPSLTRFPREGARWRAGAG